MNLILCGFQGSGKTTLGRKLAQRVNVPFYDIDETVCRKYSTGKDELFTSSKIVEAEGESVFRFIEARVIKELAHLSDSIIALGGGTLTQMENRDAISTMGMLVFLCTRHSVARQAHRLKNVSFEEIFTSRLSIFESLSAKKIMVSNDEEKTLSQIEKCWEMREGIYAR